MVLGFCLDTPADIAQGLLRIVASRDTLVTDYMGLGGLGAAFVNAGLLTLVACFIYWRSGAKINGAAVACLFLVLGFALFGKNLLNVWCVVLGVLAYARFRKGRSRSTSSTAFFGAALASIFSRIVFSTTRCRWRSACRWASRPASDRIHPLGAQPVAARLFRAHQGHSLYNIGFTAGIVGTVVVALYGAYGFVAEPVFIWTTGHNGLLGAIMFASFAVFALGGLWLDRRALGHLRLLMAQAGQAPADFLGEFGLGATLLNMGLTGGSGTAYTLLLVGGDFSTPGRKDGAILSAMGFSAIRKSPSRNILPIMVGVLIESRWRRAMRRV